MAENHIVTLCTVPDRETGEKIAQALVEEHLAACVNLLLGVASVYRWQGKVEKASECLLLIKTGVSRFDVLKRRIQELHPYDLPEIIALPIIHGSREYLNWITESTK
jgi:periplasmic divalent cation tolerance protein